MFVINGKYAYARIMIDNIEEEALRQIYDVINHPVFKGSNIAIMPDVHAGKGCVIGYTQKLRDDQAIVPNLVGVDIGCGMLSINLGKSDIDLEKFDVFIRENIPSGFNIRDAKHALFGLKNAKYKELEKDIFDVLTTCVDYKDFGKLYNRAINSVGTLGGGNHFAELGADNNGNKWLTIHSGSRNFGKLICDYHQGKAKELSQKMYIEMINSGEDKFKTKGLEFLPSGYGKELYLEHMRIATNYASINRFTMLIDMISYLYDKHDPREAMAMIDDMEHIESIHNYIDFEDNILRKGATPAREGQRVIIPFNMRDGIIIGTGKGNKDWNYSAPHGAGRVMSRSRAKSNLSLDEFKKQMENVYSTSVKQSTIDESPMVYKDSSLIKELIKDTVNIDLFIKPIYNFKA